MVGLLGLGIMWIQERGNGHHGIACRILVGWCRIFGASFLADQAKVEEVETKSISEEDAVALVAAFDNASDHRFSIIVIGGNEAIAGSDEIGDRHPTML